MSVLLDFIQQESQERRASFPAFAAGDTVNVHVKIREGNKERIQQFQGVVIQRLTLTPTAKPSPFVRFRTRSVPSVFSPPVA